jgi:diguanylate cyclase (GGDEF)-like protein
MRQTPATPPLRRMPRDLHDFAELVRESPDPAEVRAALVALAGRLAGAGRVELACGREAAAPAAGPAPGLRLPLRWGGHDWGELRLWAESPRRWPATLLRRLATLGALAASRLAPATSPGGPTGAVASPEDITGCDPATGLFGAAFFDGALAHLLAQARRRREPLSLLSIGPDRLWAIEDLLGAATADEALRRVSRAVVATLRGGDLVARPDRHALAAILPGAAAADAPRVAESVRLAVARAGAATTAMPLLTASIGLASFPDDGQEPATLCAAAAAALALARRRGGNRVEPASRPAAMEPMAVQRAG